MKDSIRKYTVNVNMEKLKDIQKLLTLVENNVNCGKSYTTGMFERKGPYNNITGSIRNIYLKYI